MIEFNQTEADAPNYLQGYGGDTSNAIIACARQGASCGYITRLGNDDFGRRFLDLWKTEGVDASGVSSDDAAHTAVYFVTHGAEGHGFSYLRRDSAASRMRAEHLPVGMIRNARYLHVSGISQAISPVARETVQAAIDIARAAGVKLSYDTNLRLKLWPLETARAFITATVAQADYLLPSLEDLQAISGLQTPDSILDWCFANGAKNVVLKCGRDGCIAATPIGRTVIAGWHVNAVDATGAGDCFDGAFLARMDGGDELVAAARYANAAAALATTGFGAVAPLPRRADVLALLARPS